jgi:hypothetical protein
MLTDDEKLAMMQAHCDEVLARLYDPPPHRHFGAVPTYLENWPDTLHSLSIASVDIPLTRSEAIALGSNNIELGEAFAPEPLSMDPIRKKLTDAFKRLGGGPAFIRLGSRSPKDVFYWPKDTFQVDNADEALQLMTAGSERILDDLKLSLHFDHLPHLFLRQWVDIPEWAEFRCYMKNRRLVAVSQYYYRKVYPEVLEDPSGILWAIEQFFLNQFRNASHLDDVVFDVVVTSRWLGRFHNWQVKLLEINPYWNLCDPCMFTWKAIDDLEASGEREFRYQGSVLGMMDHTPTIVRQSQI